MVSRWNALASLRDLPDVITIERSDYLEHPNVWRVKTNGHNASYANTAEALLVLQALMRRIEEERK